MSATASVSPQRERNRRILEAENAVAVAAVRWVEALDAINRDGVQHPSVAEFVERQQDLIAATRRYSEEARS